MYTKLQAINSFPRSTQTQLPYALHKVMFIPTIKVPQIVHICWKSTNLLQKENFVTLLNVSISEI